MKTRNGFVSNSSSSSFIIFGKEITVQDFLAKDFTNDVYCSGDQVSEGTDIFIIDKEMKEELRINPFENTYHELIEAYVIGHEDMSVTKNDLPDNFNVFHLEQSYHCTNDVDDFRDRYLTHEKVEEKDTWNKYKCPLCKGNEWEEDSFGTPTKIIVCSNCKNVRITLEK